MMLSSTLTLKCLGHGPKVGASVDIPLGLSRCLRRERLVAVGGVGVWVCMVALVSMSVRVFLASKQLVETPLHLEEDGVHLDPFLHTPNIGF